MSYDLFFRPRDGKLDEDAFVAFFEARPYYTFAEDDPDRASYFSPTTNVYFDFRHVQPGTDPDRPEGGLDFNINLFRPPTFALEARDELVAAVEHFALFVDDMQRDGIEGETFDADQFLRGWTSGNRFAYEATLTDEDAPTALHAFPRDVLHRIWLWNYSLDRLREDNGGRYAVPCIGYVTLHGKLLTIAQLDLEESTLLPHVDLVHVTRGEGAKERTGFVEWEEIYEALWLGKEVPSEEPWEHWAVTSLTAGSRAQRFLKDPSFTPPPVDSVEIDSVHASEDIAPFLRKS